MKKIQLGKPPRFLTHHVLLRTDCLVRMTLPAMLTQQEANRLSRFLDAMVVDEDEGTDDEWPFESGLTDDPDDEDLDPDEIEAEFPDSQEPITLEDIESIDAYSNSLQADKAQDDPTATSCIATRDQGCSQSTI